MLCISLAPLVLWFCGICVVYIIGCGFAGGIMLCYYLYNEALLPTWQEIVSHRKAIFVALSILISVWVLIYIAKVIFNQTEGILNISEQLTDDFIEVITAVAIGTIVSIMTIALPIIVDTMHKLADRYQTNYVLSLINRDWALVLFRILLLTSLEVSTAWVICYLYAPEKLYSVAILLFVFALLFTLSLIILVARMVYFSMPDKLFHVVERRIIKVSPPKEYFNPNVYDIFLYNPESPQEKKRQKKLQDFDSYDSDKTRLYVIVTRIFALYGSDIQLRKEILNFWERTCRAASKVEKNDIKRYTTDYYNFIYELADWAIEHNNAKLQEDTITFMGLLLNAHMGKQRKYGEKETEEHRKKYFLSHETLECLWKTMRKSVDSLSDDMFKKYWQIVNNFYSRKYMGIIQSSHDNTNAENEYAEIERYNFLILHYLCCSYLMGRKKYNLVEYVLHYSQQSKFEWYLIPNDINDALYTYLTVKEWYSDWTHKEHFSFTEDYNLFADIIISNPIAQFTILLLILFRNETDELKKMTIDKKHQPYLRQLYDTLEYTDENTDWVKYLHLEDFIKQKTNISTSLGSLLTPDATAAEACTFRKRTTQNCTTEEHCANKIVSFFKSIWSKIKNIMP